MKEFTKAQRREIGKVLKQFMLVNEYSFSAMAKEMVMSSSNLQDMTRNEYNGKLYNDYVVRLIRFFPHIPFDVDIKSKAARLATDQDLPGIGINYKSIPQEPSHSPPAITPEDLTNMVKPAQKLWEQMMESGLKLVQTAFEMRDAVPDAVASEPTLAPMEGIVLQTNNNPIASQPEPADQVDTSLYGVLADAADKSPENTPLNEFEYNPQVLKYTPDMEPWND